MTKREIINLLPGKYLVTDSICNYIYCLEKYNKEEHKIISIIYDLNDFRSRLSIHCNIEKGHNIINNGYYESIYEYNYLEIEISSSVGGIYIFSKDYYRILKDLALVGKYDDNTVSQDIRKHFINYFTNQSNYSKKQIRKINSIKHRKRYY